MSCHVMLCFSLNSFHLHSGTFTREVFQAGLDVDLMQRGVLFYATTPQVYDILVQAG